MSLKSVELQVAIPKTTEWAKLQNQHDLKPLHDHQDAALEMQKKQDEDRLRSQEAESAAKGDIKDKQERSRENGTPKRRTRSPSLAEEEEKNLQQHPFKGKIVDISL